MSILILEKKGILGKFTFADHLLLSGYNSKEGSKYFIYNDASHFKGLALEHSRE